MTEQTPDHLDNRMPGADFGRLHLRGVVRGDISKGGDSYLFATEPLLPDDLVSSTDCWRGYRSVYQLAPDGSLALLRFEFETVSDGVTAQRVEEYLSGDFWLAMPDSFLIGSATTYVPFRDGKIILDRTAWRRDEGGFCSILSVLRRPGMYTPHSSMGEVLAYLEGCRLEAWSWAQVKERVEPKSPPSREATRLLHALCGLVGIPVAVDALPLMDVPLDRLSKRLAGRFGTDEEFLRAAREILLGWPPSAPSSD